MESVTAKESKERVHSVHTLLLKSIYNVHINFLKGFRELAEHFCKGARERETLGPLVPRTKSRTSKATFSAEFNNYTRKSLVFISLFFCML